MFGGADNEVLKVFPAAGQISGAFKLCKLTENGVALCAAGDVPLGVTTPETEVTLAGEDVSVQVFGSALIQVGEDVSAGDLLTSGLDGKAVKATAGKPIFAQALNNCGEGGCVRSLIIRGGYLPSA